MCGYECAVFNPNDVVQQPFSYRWFVIDSVLSPRYLLRISITNRTITLIFNIYFNISIFWQQLAKKIQKAKSENKSKEQIGELKELFAEERAKTINLFQAMQITQIYAWKNNKNINEKIEVGKISGPKIEKKMDE